MTRVVFHIDRLVLKGFQPQDRHAIALGLQEELGRAFAAPGAASGLTALGHVSRLQLCGVPVEHGATPRHVGHSVARGIGKELGP